MSHAEPIPRDDAPAGVQLFPNCVGRDRGGNIRGPIRYVVLPGRLSYYHDPLSGHTYGGDGSYAGMGARGPHAFDIVELIVMPAAPRAPLEVVSVTDEKACTICLPDMRVATLKVTYKGLECDCGKFKRVVAALPKLLDLLKRHGELRTFTAEGEIAKLIWETNNILSELGIK